MNDDETKDQRLEDALDLLGKTFSEDEMRNMLKGQSQRVFDLLVESRRILEQFQRREQGLEDALRFVADKIEKLAPEAKKGSSDAWTRLEGLAVWIRSRLPLFGTGRDPMQPQEDITNLVTPTESLMKKGTVPIALNEKGFDQIMSQVSRKERVKFARAAKQMGLTPVELLNQLIKQKSATDPKLMMTLVPVKQEKPQ